MTLAFESVGRILLCDHSSKSSLPVLSHDAICFSQFWKINFWKLGRNLPLAIFGSERVNLWLIIFCVNCHQPPEDQVQAVQKKMELQNQGIKIIR